MGIIVLALLLMTISFIVDLPEQDLSLATYAPKVSPLEIPISSADLTLLNSLEGKLTSKYGSKLRVTKDTSSSNAASFDADFLREKKKRVDFLMGGIYFNNPSVVSGKNVYEFTTIVNTRVPTASFYLQTLAAETYIN